MARSVERRVSAATQRQALNALLFLFRNVFGLEVNGLDTVVRSRLPKRLPVVLTTQEVSRIFSRLRASHLLMASAIYGGGLRLRECLSLRVQDVDFGRSCLVIRAGKGQKDRETVLPETLSAQLKAAVELVRKVDISGGARFDVLP